MVFPVDSRRICTHPSPTAPLPSVHTLGLSRTPSPSACSCNKPENLAKENQPQIPQIPVVPVLTPELCSVLASGCAQEIWL